jgi:hypothetical protein
MACRINAEKDFEAEPESSTSGTGSRAERNRVLPERAGRAAESIVSWGPEVYDAAAALSQLRENTHCGPPTQTKRRGRPKRTFRSPTPFGPTGPNRRWKRFEAGPGLRLELTRTELENNASTQVECPQPSCGRVFGSRQALAAHLRHFPSHRSFYNENVGHRYGNSRVRIRYIAAEESHQAACGSEMAPSSAPLATARMEVPVDHASRDQAESRERFAKRNLVGGRVLGNLTNIAAQINEQGVSVCDDVARTPGALESKRVS